jgi:hypothetical protein
VVVASLEMLSGRSKKEYAKEAQAVAEGADDEPPTNGAAAENGLESTVAVFYRAAGLLPGLAASSQSVLASQTGRKG